MLPDSLEAMHFDHILLHNLVLHVQKVLKLPNIM